MTSVIARVRGGVSLAKMPSLRSAVQHMLHVEHPTEAVSDYVAPQSLLKDLGRKVKQPLYLLMCSMLCMLFIGCLNIANVLVARCVARQREMAIRSAENTVQIA